MKTKTITKKWIALLLVICMMAWILPEYDVVAAANEEQEEFDETMGEVEAELGVEFPEELEIDLTEETEESLHVELNLDTEDVDAQVELEMDFEAGEFTVYGEETDADGNVIHYEYDIIIHEADEDVFVATFIDMETGETFEVDTTELQASAVPVVAILIAVARYGVQYAIKKFGKKAVQNAVKKVSKSNSPVWKDLKNYKGKTKTNGKSGSKRRYYQWDHTHNDIEVYDSNRRHLGSMDPITGKMIKGPVKGRTIKL